LEYIASQLHLSDVICLQEFSNTLAKSTLYRSPRSFSFERYPSDILVLNMARARTFKEKVQILEEQTSTMLLSFGQRGLTYLIDFTNLSLSQHPTRLLRTIVSKNPPVRRFNIFYPRHSSLLAYTQIAFRTPACTFAAWTSSSTSALCLRSIVKSTHRTRQISRAQDILAEIITQVLRSF